MVTMNSSHSVMSALERARQRLADILTPGPSVEFDRQVGRLLAQLDEASIIATLRRHVDDDAAARLGEALKGLRERKGIKVTSRERDDSLTIRLHFERGNLTAEREFMHGELAEIVEWIDRMVARSEANTA